MISEKPAGRGFTAGVNRDKAEPLPGFVRFVPHVAKYLETANHSNFTNKKGAHRDLIHEDSHRHGSLLIRFFFEPRAPFVA